MVKEQQSDLIYVFGHKSPDTDTICSSIAYAELLKKMGKEAKPFRLGEINNETKFVLEKFGVDVPELLESAKDKDVVLIDHNSFEESAEGIEEARIHAIIDHHKMNFRYNEPITIITLPWGCTATIIATIYEHLGIEIEKKMAGLLLSAILSDTVIFKSPTTTEKDKEWAEKLAKICGIDDILAFGTEMFKHKSNLKDKTPREIILLDSKVLTTSSGKKIRVSQVEVVDDKEILEKKGELLKEMEKILEEENLFGILLLVTNIMKEGSTMLILAKDLSLFEKAFNTEFKDNEAYLPGLMSRKKQVIPKIADL